MQELLKNSNIKEKNQIYYSSQSEQTQHSNTENYNGASIIRGSSRGLESGSTKRGGEHHIAIGHGPMVQGGLLTAYVGGFHGDRWSPRGVPPSGRVPGQLLLAAPILKWRRRRYGEENGNSRSILGVSSTGAKYRPRGHRRGPQGSQEGGRCALGGPRQGPS